MSTVLHRVRENEQGFSLAEVVIAMVLFVAVILGIATMIMSGSSAVTKGSMENIATQLAQKKLEDVKTLAFYSPWTGINKDIDDFYWNPNCAGGYNDNVDQLTTEQPHTNTVAYEDYGNIPGYGKFKRTTAIQYQVMTTTATTSQMTAAAMNTNWVPKPTDPSATKVVSPQFDSPAGGATSASNDKIRFMTVEVRVYYRQGDNGTEQSYLARATVSDLMVTGGSNNPLIVVKNINPTQGTLNTDNLPMDITVESEGLQADYDAGTAIVTTKLWYEGQDEIPCNESSCVISGNGTNIACSFNLRSRTGVKVRAGMYSLEVYWQDKGWKDTSFRDCFTVIVGHPVINSISNFTWGHKGENLRQITVSGTSLDDCTIDIKRGSTVIPGGVTSNDGSTLKANFDLTSISTQDAYWDIEVTTVAGTASTASDPTNANRFYVNPKSVIKRISTTSPGNWYSWAHSAQTARRVEIEGSYLYGYDDAITSNEKWMYYGSTIISNTGGEAKLISYSGDDVPDPLNQVMVLEYNPSLASVGYNLSNTLWTVHLKNYGGVAESTSDPATKILFNPPPQITAITPTNVTNGNYDWANSNLMSRYVQVQGNYLYGLSDSGASGVMTYSSYTTLDVGTGRLISGPPLNDDIGLGDSAILNFNPNSASSASYWTTPNSNWNVQVKNYGGTGNSSDNTAYVVMNPPPTITSVTATSSPSYYNWAYLTQMSRTIQVHGTNLYALGVTGATAQLTYGSFATSSTGYTIVTGAGSNYAKDSDVTTTITYNPSSSGAASAAYNKYWNVKMTNFGGTANSDLTYLIPTKTVFMNPIVSSLAITSWSTSDTGTGQGGVNPAKTLSVSISGNYLQSLPANPTVYIGQTNGQVPYPNPCIYQILTGGTVSADGTTMTGMTADISVNPMHFANISGATPTNDASITGQYYIYLVNPDGQTAPSGPHHTLTNNLYTISFGSFQNTNSNTLFGKPSTTGGTYYQDATVPSVTATACNTGNIWTGTPYATFIDWRVGSTSTVYSTANPISGITATANLSINCRYSQYLYFYGGKAGTWANGYTDNPYVYQMDSTDLGSSYPCIKTWGEWSSGDGRGECSAVDGPLNLTGCSDVDICWTNQDGSANGEAFVEVGNGPGGDYNTYDYRYLHQPYSVKWGLVWESLAFSGEGASKYIRIFGRGAEQNNGNWARIYTAAVRIQ